MTDSPISPQRLSFEGWHRWVTALALGLLAAAALPPVYVIPLLWPALAGLAFLNHSAKSWRWAAFEGWLFGLGWFGAGLYWIGHAFLVDAERFGWVMPFAVGAMAAGMALYVALSSGLVQALVQRYRLGRTALLPVFAGAWTLAEWLRGWLLTGFPWNPMASVWGISTELMQTASWVGSLGLSFLTVLIFAAPAALPMRRTGGERRAGIVVLALSLLLPLLWGMGALRLAGGGTMTRDGVVLRIVQPSIPQKLKWRSDLRQQHVLKQMAMSSRTAGPAGAPTHIIWAETNVPYMIEPDSHVPGSLAAAVPAGGYLVFGAPRRDAAGQYFNSLFVIDDDGRLDATFDKFHLVPFGEYVPLRGILPFDWFLQGRGDFTPGGGPHTIRLDGLPPFAPIICYEVIFSGQVIDAADRPEWILNITNDAWFGPSTGPHQHLVQARLRAVEEGLPVVRAANNGISAVIDSYGRVRNALGLGEQGVVDAPLPVAIDPPPFALIGPTIGLFMALLGLLSAMHGPIRRRLGANS